MKRMIRQIRALALLAFQAIILQPLKRLRNLARSGEVRFLESYSPDRLLPLTPEERVGRERFGACIHCGLCDVSCDVLSKARRTRIASLSAVAIGYGRSMSEYPFARLSLEALSGCDDCRRCETVCPMGVPLREMIDDLLGHAHRLEEAGVGLGGASLARSGEPREEPSREPRPEDRLEKAQ